MNKLLAYLTVKRIRLGYSTEAYLFIVSTLILKYRITSTIIVFDILFCYIRQPEGYCKPVSKNDIFFCISVLQVFSIPDLKPVVKPHIYDKHQYQA